MARRNPERCYRFTALKRKASFSSSGSLLAPKKSVVGACFACVSNRGGSQALEAGKSVVRGRLGEMVQTFRTAHQRFSVTRFMVTGFHGGGADGA
jgi:hypothetical protein